jgi:amino acid adenylation domain-containing protein
VRLDADWPEIEHQPGGRASRTIVPEHLAYVLFTSGSTGRPKGVMLHHRGLVEHHLAVADLYDLGPDDRVLQFCSISFDVSVEELFPTWASGGTVVLRDDTRPVLGRAWHRWLDDQAVTVLNLPTAYWHEWGRDLHQLGLSLPPALRLVIAGGERALGSAYRTWLRVGGDRVRWINAYGPAETSVIATAHDRLPGFADDAALDGAGTVDLTADPPIGLPVGRATIHLLDDGWRPVAPGTVGELCIGGPGVTRGYLGRPDLTADAFVPDPFADEAGARLYRTGDLARCRPDGELEFVDRVDRQVKVRGVRIEVAEVEAAVAAHPDVAEAVVVVQEQVPGDKRLVAYVVGHDRPPRSNALRRFVAERLPASMVPSAFVGLSALPRSPNGKVDHHALPGPRRDRPDLATPWVEPRTATEEALAALWSRVLGIDGIGVDDDFFDLGGHSLLATQVVSELRETFGDVPLQTLFTAPTVAALAVELDTGDDRRERNPALVHEPRDADTPVPLSLAQEQMLRLQLAARPPVSYNVTAQHRFSTPVDVGALRRALEHLAARHETLRTSVHAASPAPYQQVTPTVAVDLEVTDLSDTAPAEREERLRQLVGEQDGVPFHLARAPLFRPRLYLIDEHTSELAVTFDHQVCDLTSAYIFLSELTTAYEAAQRGDPPRLPALPVQYADFAVWQRRWLTEDRLEAQLQYWRQKLAGMPSGPALAVDHVPDTMTRRIGRRQFSVPQAVYRQAEALARSDQATLFVVCVSAVSALLSRLGDTPDVVLSTTLSGRQRNELENVIGMFAGVARIRTDLDGDPSFTEVVGRARETVLGLFDHQDVPFMWVRDALFPDFPKQASGVRLAEILPVEILYFHASHDHWAPGSAVVGRPGPEPPADDVYVRGQLIPLSITFYDDGTQMWGNISYKLDFYEPRTVDHLAAGLEQLLAAAAHDPALRLSELPTPTLPGR